MPEVLLSLGSNLEPQRHLAQALDALPALPQAGAAQASALYRCPAVGFDGPDFVNAALRMPWCGSLEALQAAVHEIEDAAERDRNAPRFASRTLDIDIVLYGALVSEAGSGIPRAELLREAFVLRPCAEIAPEWVHPQTGQTLAAHWADWRARQADPLRPL